MDEAQSRIAAYLSRRNLAGALGEARIALQDRPEDRALRFVVFELNLMLGDFAGARGALPGLFEDDDEAGIWSGLIDAEEARYRFHREGEGAPGSLDPPPSYGGPQVTAAVAHARGRPDAVRACLAEVAAPTIAGAAELKSGERLLFDDLRDLSDLVGPFFPALAPGAYLWLPLADLARIDFVEQSGGALEELLRPADVTWQPRAGAPPRRGRLWVPLAAVDDGRGLTWGIKPAEGVMLDDDEGSYTVAFGWRCLRLIFSSADERRVAISTLRSLELSRRSP